MTAWMGWGRGGGLLQSWGHVDKGGKLQQRRVEMTSWMSQGEGGGGGGVPQSWGHVDKGGKLQQRRVEMTSWMSQGEGGGGYRRAGGM